MTLSISDGNRTYINSSKDDATWRSFTEAEHEEIRKQKAAEPKPEPPPGLAPEIKEAGLAEYVKLYTAPFTRIMPKTSEDEEEDEDDEE